MTPQQFNALAGEPIKANQQEPQIPDFMTPDWLAIERSNQSYAQRKAARRKAENKRFLKIVLAVCTMSFALGVVLAVM